MSSWERELLAAEGYLELGMLEAAEELLGELSSEDRGRVETREVFCRLSLQSEKWEAAAEIALELTDSHPQNPQHWIHLAYATRRCQSVEQAQGILQRAIELHPTEWCIHYNLACYAAVQGKFGEAHVRLKQALKIEPACRPMALEDPDLIALRMEI